MGKKHLAKVAKEGDFLVVDTGKGPFGTIYVMDRPRGAYGATVYPSQSERSNVGSLTDRDAPLTDSDWDQFCERFGFKPVVAESELTPEPEMGLKVGDRIDRNADYDALPVGSEVGYNFNGAGKFTKQLNGMWHKFNAKGLYLGSRASHEMRGTSSDAGRPILRIGPAVVVDPETPEDVLATREDAEARAADAEAKVAELLERVAQLEAELDIAALMVVEAINMVIK